jgi:hypothetical protein
MTGPAHGEAAPAATIRPEVSAVSVAASATSLSGSVTLD